MLLGCDLPKVDIPLGCDLTRTTNNPAIALFIALFDVVLSGCDLTKSDIPSGCDLPLVDVSSTRDLTKSDIPSGCD